MPENGHAASGVTVQAVVNAQREGKTASLRYTGTSAERHPRSDCCRPSAYRRRFEIDCRREAPTAVG